MNRTDRLRERLASCREEAEFFYSDSPGEWGIVIGWLDEFSALLATSGEPTYDELISAVETKVPDETRHETALRYIQQAEADQLHGFDRETVSAIGWTEGYESAVASLRQWGEHQAAEVLSKVLAGQRPGQAGESRP